MQSNLPASVLECKDQECFPYIHATLMTAAWLFFAGFGIITARHYRPILGKCGSKDTWFPVHVTFMVITFLLTIAGFVVIFVKEEGLSHVSPGLSTAHVATGIITTILCVINPFMALCRCHPDNPRRPIFNWAHYGVGMLAHAFGVLTIAIGVSHPQFTGIVQSAEWTRYLVYVYVALHLVVMLFLELVNCCTGRKNTGEAYAMGNSNDHLVSGSQSNLKGRNLKMWVYGGYFWVVFGLTGMILLGIWNPIWIKEIIIPEV